MRRRVTPLAAERSLLLEKQKRALNPKQWDVLVDNLGMAYGKSGDMSKAKETFEYRTQETRTYPMFRYNLACAASELGNLDVTLEQLKLAFQYKSNSNPGEGIPDPAKDDCFKRYLSDPRFAKLIKNCAQPARGQKLAGYANSTHQGWANRFAATLMPFPDVLLCQPQRQLAQAAAHDHLISFRVASSRVTKLEGRLA